MKFSELVDKFDKLARKTEKGKSVKPEKVNKLQQLLAEKQSHYRTKLASTEDPNKRKKLETRLKVVTAQLEKSKQLPTAD